MANKTMKKKTRKKVKSKKPAFNPYEEARLFKWGGDWSNSAQSEKNRGDW